MRYLFAAVLALALTACGSTSEKGKAGAASQGSADAASESIIPRDTALENWIEANYGKSGKVGYLSSEFDLDDDGTPEELVYIGGPNLCGTGGCSLAVLKRDDDVFTPVTVTSVTRLPLGVLNTSTNGWRDLWVTIGGGGEMNNRRVLRFNGTTYPTNPTVPPAETLTALDSQVLIPEGALIWLS
jgi:hypothetical protein